MTEKDEKKLTSMTFLFIIALRNKMVAHTFLPSFDHVKGLSRKIVDYHGNLMSQFKQEIILLETSDFNLAFF